VIVDFWGAVVQACDAIEPHLAGIVGRTGRSVFGWYRVNVDEEAGLSGRLRRALPA
jgi:thioredoxin-like negative regulator of GroEL